MKEQDTTQQDIEQEKEELNAQFSEFLHTKGIAAKFRLAFSNMGESAAKQRAEDRENFAAIKQQSAENNKEFVEFLHTKGMKAKVRLVIENVKEGAKNAQQDVAAQTAANTAGIPHFDVHGHIVREQTASAQALAEEFAAYLKEKGLDGKYSIEITEKE